MTFQEKMTRAFDNLNAVGILAKADFTCCGSCGHHEASEICHEDGQRGYVFWHDQNKSAFKEGKDLHLGFWCCAGSKQDEDIRATEIAKIACAALKNVGLEVDWADLSHNICVRGHAV